MNKLNISRYKKSILAIITAVIITAAIMASGRDCFADQQIP